MDRQTDGQTDGQTDICISRAAFAAENVLAFPNGLENTGVIAVKVLFFKFCDSKYYVY